MKVRLYGAGGGYHPKRREEKHEPDTDIDKSASSKAKDAFERQTPEVVQQLKDRLERGRFNNMNPMIKEIIQELLTTWGEINTPAGQVHDSHCDCSQCEELKIRESILQALDVPTGDISATKLQEMSDEEWEQFIDRALQQTEIEQIKKEGRMYLQELRTQAEGLSDVEKEAPWTFQEANLSRAGNIVLYRAEQTLRDIEIRTPESNQEEKSFKGQDLSGQNLSGQDFSNWDLQQINLQGAILSKTIFVTAKMQGAILQDTNLIGAQLQGAQLQGANMRGVWLWKAKLCGADLEGVDLTLADLRTADLQGAHNLTVEQLASAIVDETTKLPLGITLKDIESARGSALNSTPLWPYPLSPASLSL